MKKTQINFFFFLIILHHNHNIIRRSAYLKINVDLRMQIHQMVLQYLHPHLGLYYTRLILVELGARAGGAIDLAFGTF